MQLEDRTHVVGNAELAKHRVFLRQIGQSELRTTMNRHMGKILAIALMLEANIAAIRRHQADNHVEAGCLAGAVGTQ